MLRSTGATIYRASLPRGHTGRRGHTDTGRGYTGGSLNRRTRPREIAISRHSSCRTSAWRQSSVPKPQAITQRQLPESELSSSSFRSLHCLRGITPLWWSKSATDKPRDYLSANQRHMGFDEPASPNVEYLAAVQAVFVFCHRRVFRNALTLTGTRISSCAASNRPIQMMSGK